VTPQQLMAELNAAETPWDLLDLAAAQQQHMLLPHRLRLLFRYGIGLLQCLSLHSIGS
jgi:hypothetical protein